MDGQGYPSTYDKTIGEVRRACGARWRSMERGLFVGESQVVSGTKKCETEELQVR